MLYHRADGLSKLCIVSRRDVVLAHLRTVKENLVDIAATMETNQVLSWSWEKLLCCINSHWYLGFQPCIIWIRVKKGLWNLSPLFLLLTILSPISESADFLRSLASIPTLGLKAPLQDILSTVSLGTTILWVSIHLVFWCSLFRFLFLVYSTDHLHKTEGHIILKHGLLDYYFCWIKCFSCLLIVCHL